MNDSEKTLEVADLTMEETEKTEAVPEEKTGTNEKELEFTDVSSETEVKNVGAEDKQSEEENSKYAQARRKAEAETRLKVKEAEKKAYEKGKMEAFKGKTNPYTNTVIEDETDVQVYQDMYELERMGKDPVADYALYIAEKKRQEEKAIKAQLDLEKEVEQDIAEFTEKYPDINLTELLNDEAFKDYIDGKRKPLTKLYENYKKLETSFRNKAVEVAKQTIANSQSTPGSLGSGSDVSIDYNNMSKEEFEKYVIRAKNGEL